MSTPTDARNLQTRIADHLRAQIETGQLKPGQQLLVIDELVASYKCSAGPVQRHRTAEQQGRLVHQQGRGTLSWRVPGGPPGNWR